jgi:hypothetical protein
MFWSTSSRKPSLPSLPSLEANRISSKPGALRDLGTSSLAKPRTLRWGSTRAVLSPSVSSFRRWTPPISKPTVSPAFASLISFCQHYDTLYSTHSPPGGQHRLHPDRLGRHLPFSRSNFRVHSQSVRQNLLPPGGDQQFLDCPQAHRNLEPAAAQGGIHVEQVRCETPSDPPRRPSLAATASQWRSKGRPDTRAYSIVPSVPPFVSKPRLSPGRESGSKTPRSAITSTSLKWAALMATAANSVTITFSLERIFRN